MGQTDEETIAGNFKTTSIAAYVRKEKTMKKKLVIVSLAALLVVAFCTPTSALSAGCSIRENGQEIGSGTIWDIAIDEYTLCGDTMSDEYSNVSVSVFLYYYHYDLFTYECSSNSESETTHYAYTSVTVRPNQGTADVGEGWHTVNGIGATSYSAW